MATGSTGIFLRPNEAYKSIGRHPALHHVGTW